MGIRPHNVPSNIMSVATDRRILSLLVRARMSLRRQRRNTIFYHRLARTGRNPRIGLEDELSALFPPRRAWPRPGLPARRAALARGLDPMSIALVDWLLRNISKPKRESPDWLRRLRRFVGSVRGRIRHWAHDTSFQKPQIYVVLKSRAIESGQPDSFRCLATYTLRDRIVISIASRYLREISDNLMHPGSFAFRTQSPNMTHHSAVDHMMGFRRNHSGKPLWVAEVDIRGFFDVVEHQVAWDAVSSLLEALPQAPCVNDRALLILKAYLSSYSFNKLGRQEAEQKAREQQRSGHGAEVPWPTDELLALGVDTERDRVGIPQGGALSCFLANAILHQADWAVHDAVLPRSGMKQEALYLRYCDDIICLATSRATCEQMANAYRAALCKLKLPAHDMLVFDRVYKDQRESEKGGFWSGKSKAPYEWGPPDKPGRVPWCAFVGYHVRYDGVLRIRPSSVKKEIENHNRILSEIRRHLRRREQARSKRQILYRFRQRLRSITVGSGTVGDDPEPPVFSWTQGFRLLRKYPSLSGQLRDLDRHRVSRVRALSRHLQRLGTAMETAPIHDGLEFEGFPFSYAGLVERNPSTQRNTNEENSTCHSDIPTAASDCTERHHDTATALEGFASSWPTTQGVTFSEQIDPRTLNYFGMLRSFVSSYKKRGLAKFGAILLVLVVAIGYILLKVLR